MMLFGAGIQVFRAYFSLFWSVRIDPRPPAVAPSTIILLSADIFLSVGFVSENRWKPTDLGVTPKDVPTDKNKKLVGTKTKFFYK